MKIKVMITNEQKVIKIPSGIRLLVRRCCHAVLITEEMEGNFEVGVNFVDDEHIKDLNKEYRGLDKSTDVLSFSLVEDDDENYEIDPETGNKMLGDIVISLETAQKQARIYGHSLQREIAYLTVHSMLHLLGYDHTDGGIETAKMREKEEAVLEKLGLSRIESFEQYDKK